MKAITLWQPWASLIAHGAKKYETRSWATKYRGPIAIHAALKDPCKLPLFGKEDFEEAVRKAIGNVSSSWATLPLGAVVATAELVECWDIVYHPGTNIDVAKNIEVGAELNVPKHHPRFGDYVVPTEQEFLFGDWTPGRFAWELQNIQLLPAPIFVKGHQGLWNFDLEKEAARDAAAELFQPAT